MVPPGHPCRFLFLFFLFFFSFFSFLFFFPLLFVVLRVPFLVPFSFVFVLSSCRFPFDSCIAFAFTFASLLSLGGGFCYILLFRVGATPPPRAPCEPEVCVFPLRAVLLPCVAVDLSSFSLLFLPFFDFDLGIVCFHPVFFLWVLCCLLGFDFCCYSFNIICVP